MKDAREVLRNLLQTYGLEERARGFRAAECWPELVGPALAAVSAVTDFRAGRLTVAVRGASAMQELLMRRAELVEALARRAGSELVREIHLVPAGGRLDASGR